MNPPRAGGSDPRLLHELSPSFGIELSASALLWVAYFCSAMWGFDLLSFFHRGPAFSTRTWLWLAVLFSLAMALVIAGKIRTARVLRTRGMTAPGTILSAVRSSTKATRGQYLVDVKFIVDGKEQTSRQYTDHHAETGMAVTIVYDPLKPARCRVCFATGKA